MLQPRTTIILKATPIIDQLCPKNQNHYHCSTPPIKILMQGSRPLKLHQLSSVKMNERVHYSTNTKANGEKTGNTMVYIMKKL